jgi:hypothetical protein
VLAVALLVLFAPRGAAAQTLHGQHWEVVPAVDSATVGDSVLIRFRLRLDERDLLFDTIPRPSENTPAWVRVLGVERLTRHPDRIFTGRAWVAFYRTGEQPVPVFELPFMRSVKGLTRGTLRSDTASVDIVPLVSDPSSATLRDIKEPPPRQGPGVFALAGGLFALLVAGFLAWRIGRRRVEPAPVEPAAAEAPPPMPPDPYELALARLDEIEHERWGERDVVRHYESVTDTLRDYLESRGVPARERTTTELRWQLPPAMLAGGVRHRFEEVFEDADLVKFAKWRPDPATAGLFLGSAKDLLARWRAVRTADEVLDAVR